MLSDNYDNNRYPVGENGYEEDDEYNCYFTDEDDMTDFPACSAHDCTGLSPSGRTDKYLEELNNVYQFGVPDKDDLQF